jgi:hypothetical protein
MVKIRKMEQIMVISDLKDLTNSQLLNIQYTLEKELGCLVKIDNGGRRLYFGDIKTSDEVKSMVIKYLRATGKTKYIIKAAKFNYIIYSYKEEINSSSIVEFDFPCLLLNGDDLLNIINEDDNFAAKLSYLTGDKLYIFKMDKSLYITGIYGENALARCIKIAEPDCIVEILK